MAAAKGNQYAAKERRFLAMLQRVLDNEGDGDALRRIAMKVVACAEEGQSWAIQEVANRLDGKPVQQVQMDGDLTMHRTYKDLTDHDLMAIAQRARAGAEQDGDGETLN